MRTRTRNQVYRKNSIVIVCINMICINTIHSNAICIYTICIYAICINTDCIVIDQSTTIASDRTKGYSAAF